MEQADEFKDIRPYRDDEIREVLLRIARHPWIAELVRRYRFPYISKRLFPLVRPLVSWGLSSKVKQVRSVDQFQREFIVKLVLDTIRRKSTDGISADGLDALNRDTSYLFMSNHRDITLDPAYINYFLALHDLNITEIAFGDNLMINDLVADLIRVNRSFIVHRGLSPRDQLASSIRLSRYIDSRIQEGQSIWIAQREGRAKDGDDRTNPAVIKMLYLAHRKSDVDYTEMVRRYCIVPVAVSYEFDPCDRMKAWEIYRKENKGTHSKGKFEDLASMYAGIQGYKGRIHYQYCDPLTGEYSSEKEVAEAIDRAIHRGYRLWPNNYIGYDLLHGGSKYLDRYSQEELETFNTRFRRLPPQVRTKAWAAYAKPVENREALD
ncbi:acyltransferase [Marispirochaeta aestuarii]|uniref:acyltransferase n=1 Tax=Marispirochaeta aestuarii TaxID=1963862 RepID=UPI0029C8BEAB|nr:acyltransferase [Marispirochaeta aestuarii]